MIELETPSLKLAFPNAGSHRVELVRLVGWTRDGISGATLTTWWTPFEDWVGARPLGSRGWFEMCPAEKDP